MRISEYFELGLTQHELDFVDVDTTRDVELYIDPAWIHIEEDEWARQAAITLSGFFNHIIDLYERNEIDRARELFDFAHEPNETCFGLSVNNPEGTGASAEMLSKVFDKMLENDLIDRGFITRLEDIHVFIEAFGQDRLSDLVTNIIRKHLVDFTLEQCEKHGIQVNNEARNIGHYWDNDQCNWAECNQAPLIVDDKAILMVPKRFVVKNYRYTTGQYLTHHVLVKRQDQHLANNSHLVRENTRRNGEIARNVYKKDIREEEIKGANINEKQYVRQVTEESPELIREFRSSIANRLRNPATTNRLSDDEFILIVTDL